MSCFCESFVVWNGYVHKENHTWTKLPRGPLPAGSLWVGAAAHEHWDGRGAHRCSTRSWSFICHIVVEVSQLVLHGVACPYLVRLHVLQTFYQYRLEADQGKRWGGIWQAPTTHGQQSSVELIEMWDSWEETNNLATGKPTVNVGPGVFLGAASSTADSSGAIICNEGESSAPYLAERPSPDVVRYWIREGTRWDVSTISYWASQHHHRHCHSSSSLLSSSSASPPPSSLWSLSLLLSLSLLSFYSHYILLLLLSILSYI